LRSLYEISRFNSGSFSFGRPFAWRLLYFDISVRFNRRYGVGLDEVSFAFLTIGGFAIHPSCLAVSIAAFFLPFDSFLNGGL
jgi:hypothetical protein